MSNLFDILFFVLFLLFVVFIFILFKKISLVKENSVRVQKLLKLNKKSEFNKKCKLHSNITHYVKKKEEVATLDIIEVFSEIFLSNFNNVLINFENVYNNEINYAIYKKKFLSINDTTGKDFVRLTKLNNFLFKKIENFLFRILKIKPVVNTKIKLTIRYDGMKEKNTYKNTKVFTYDEIRKIYKDNIKDE